MKNIKSLNDIPNINEPIFSAEIMDFINKEGFEYGNIDSYCYQYSGIEKFHEKAYVKNIESTSYTINCYIFENGIGLDIDYDCDGNLNNFFCKFENSTFEDCYNKLVDKVNEYR